MHPPTKDQSDIGVDNPTLDCSDLPDTARQEFAQEADINYMLSRFNITPARGAPQFGEWDDTIDLQTAITATREAREAYRRVPKELREKFSSMEQLLQAIETGALQIREKPEEPVTPTPA